ncbi:hypothetical protein [Stieleria varia]|nr:hypothetical protein [Stieleria varia]
MYMKHTFLLVAAMLFLGQASAEAQNRVRLETDLSPTSFARQVEPLASGAVKYEEKGSVRKFSCEMEDLFFVQTVIVRRGSIVLGILDVDNFGMIDLNLETELGDRITRMRAGNVIRVYDFDTGRQLFFARLQPRN